MNEKDLEQLYDISIKSYDELLHIQKQHINEIERLNNKIDKAIELIDLIKPELWNISNSMTYKLIDIKNILKGSDE